MNIFQILSNEYIMYEYGAVCINIIHITYAHITNTHIAHVYNKICTHRYHYHYRLYLLCVCVCVCHV